MSGAKKLHDTTLICRSGERHLMSSCNGDEPSRSSRAAPKWLAPHRRLRACTGPLSLKALFAKLASSSHFLLSVYRNWRICQEFSRIFLKIFRFLRKLRKLLTPLLRPAQNGPGLEHRDLLILLVPPRRRSPGWGAFPGGSPHSGPQRANESTSAPGQPPSPAGEPGHPRRRALTPRPGPPPRGW